MLNCNCYAAQDRDNPVQDARRIPDVDKTMLSTVVMQFSTYTSDSWVHKACCFQSQIGTPLAPWLLATMIARQTAYC